MATPPTYVRGTSGDDDTSARNEGSVVVTGEGNDTLRGRGANDVLIGGGGDDQMYGGGGADQFRFFGDNIEGAADTDRIYDLDFAEGDTLVFGRYGVGMFEDEAGVNAFGNGTAAQISSVEGLRNLVEDSGGAITAAQRGNTDTLILTLQFGDKTQHIHLSNYWSLYSADTPAL